MLACFRRTLCEPMFRPVCIFCIFLLLLIHYQLFNIFPKPSISKIFNSNKIEWYRMGTTRSDVLLVLFGCNSFNIDSILEDPNFPCSVLLMKCDPQLGSFDCKDESLYYLRYFLDIYDNPPNVTAIIMAHAHETSYHYLIPLHIRIKEILSFPNYLQNNSYGGIYCKYNREFTLEYQVRSLVIQKWLWNYVFVGTSLEKWPKEWEYPCCGTFFFHPEVLRKKPKWEYELIIENLVSLSHHVPLTHNYRHCGRIMEAAWDLLLSGKPAAIPPDCNLEKIYLP